MEHIIKFESKGHDVTFFCDARNTRSGFAHDTRMYIDGMEWSTGCCHYLNRTWEHYRFQSVCLAACDNFLEEKLWDLKDEYKRERNIQRVVGEKRKTELREIIDADPEVILFRDIKQTLRERSF